MSKDSNTVAKKRKQMRERIRRQEAATAVASALIAADTEVPKVPTIAKDLEAESEAERSSSTPLPDTTLNSDQKGFVRGKEKEVESEILEDNDDNDVEESGSDTSGPSDTEVSRQLLERTNQGATNMPSFDEKSID